MVAILAILGTVLAVALAAYLLWVWLPLLFSKPYNQVVDTRSYEAYETESSGRRETIENYSLERVRIRLLPGRRRFSSRPSLFVGAAFAIAAYAGLQHFTADIPARDAAQFSSWREVALQFYWNGFDASRNPDATLTLRIPRSVRADEDADILVRHNLGATAEGTGESAPATSELLASRDYEVRTGSPCQAEPGIAKSTRGGVCTLGVAYPGGKQFSWTIRAGKPSSGRFDALVPEDFARLLESAPQWASAISEDGKRIAQYVIVDAEGKILRPWKPGESRTNLRQVPVIINVESPVFARLGVDLAQRQLHFTQIFETTLGVNAFTWQVLQILGTALSFILGGGWLWKILRKQDD